LESVLLSNYLIDKREGLALLTEPLAERDRCESGHHAEGVIALATSVAEEQHIFVAALFAVLALDGADCLSLFSFLEFRIPGCTPPAINAPPGTTPRRY